MSLIDVNSNIDIMRNKNVDVFISAIKTMGFSSPKTAEKIISTLEYLGNIFLYVNRDRIDSLKYMEYLLDNYMKGVVFYSEGDIEQTLVVCNRTNNILETDRNALIYIKPRYKAIEYKINLKLMFPSEFESYCFNRE